MKKTNTSDMENQNKLINDYIYYYQSQYKNCSEKFLKWFKNNIARIVELDNGGLLAIEKPKIKTDFCFSYGYCGVSTNAEQEQAKNMSNYAKTSVNYFINENLKQLTDITNLINEYLNSEKPGYVGIIPLTPYIVEQYGDGKTKDLHFMDAWKIEYLSTNVKNLYKKATIIELNSILIAYDIVIKDFKKRLQTYLKRFGLRKLNTWAFLSD